MARIKRVGGRTKPAVQKDKKGLLKSKKFWIIFSSVLVALIAIGVTIGLVVYFNNKKDEKKDYFRSCEEVEFEYASYDRIVNYANPDFNNPQGKKDVTIEYMFVLVYNSANFYPSKTDNESKYLEADEDLLKRMIDLQKTINTSKEAGKNVELFIVDTNYSWNVNAYTESLFGGLYTDDSSSYDPMLVYIENGEYKASYNEYDYDNTLTDKDIYISSNNEENNGLSEAYINNTLFNRITIFIKNFMGKDK